jgi:WD40 repeat protein
VLAVAWSPNGKWLASASRDGEVWLWDVERGIPIGAPLAGHKEGASAVAWSPDGSRLATGDVTGVLRLWRFTDATLIATVPPQGSPINSIRWSPDGTRLGIATLDGLRVDHVGTTVHTISYVPGAGILNEFAWSPDGLLLAAAGDAGPVQLFDPDGERVGYLARGESHSSAVAFSPDGRRVAIGLDDGTLEIWAAVDEREACRITRAALTPGVLRALLGTGRPAPLCSRANLDAELPPIPAVPAGHVFAARP